MITPISPKQLIAWQMNPRKRIDEKSLQPLIDSMRSVGWFGAIMVRPTEDGLYQVMAGERRWRAALAVGLEEIACEVREMDDKAAIELAVIENRDREDLDVIEEAGGYRAMVDLGWSVAEIASRSGRSEAAIYRKLDLLSLDAATQDALRDGLLSIHTAGKLGMIEDSDQRAKALERVVKPTYQDTPLSEKQAVPMIQREFLDPQKRQKAWEKRCKALRKEHGAEVEIVSVAEAGRFRMSYEYVACENAVPEHELAANVREDEEFEAPTWGALAEKHGARRYAVPDDAGAVEFYVEREPLITAEQVAGEKDPEACIFPLRGEGRHAQALSREKTFSEQEAERKERCADVTERQAALVKRLYAGFVGDERMSLHEQEGVIVRLSKVLAERELLDTLNEVPVALGVDLETLGDGDDEKGFAIWLERLMGGGEVLGDVLAMLLLASSVMRLWPYAPDAAEVMGMMEGVFDAESDGGEDEGDEEPKDVLPEVEDEFAVENVLVTAEGLKEDMQKGFLEAVLAKHGPKNFRALDEYRQWNEADKHLVKLIQEMINGLGEEPEEDEEPEDPAADDDAAWTRVLRARFEDREVIFAAVDRALKATGSIVFQVEGKALLKALGTDGLRATRSYLQSDELDEQREGYDKKRGKRAEKFFAAISSMLAAAGG